MIQLWFQKDGELIHYKMRIFGEEVWAGTDILFDRLQQNIIKMFIAKCHVVIWLIKTS